MKIALITDTHWGVRNDSPVFLDYFQRSIKDFLDYVKWNKIQHVIHLGDLFDRRKYINFQTASRCRTDFLEQLEALAVTTHIIAGNHDEYYKNDHKINSLKELVAGRYKGIHVYDEPRLLNIGGLDIQLMPWITESNYDQSMETLRTTTAPVVMGHFEIAGFRMFKDSVSDHGLDRSLFDRFHRVYSGHFHHKSTSGCITYLGAFAEYTWSDYNDPRGFHVFDTETQELEFIQNKHSMFRMTVYDDKDQPDIIQTINQTDYSDMANTYVKIVCLNKTNPYAFDVLLDKVYKAGPINISVLEDASTFTDNTDEVIDEAEDTPTILKKYIDGLTLGVNSDRMQSYMKNIYNEALTIDYGE